ncbi:MAG TPA: helix-turn-helix transcriptional regulator [Streptosporangiaceae bacterium]
MVNERLRRCMLRAGLDIATLAENAQVSTKTVERWLRGEVVPYPRTRYRVAAILQEDESYICGRRRRTARRSRGRI